MTGSSASFKSLTDLLFHKKNEKPSYEARIIKITREAYKKINLYARIVSEIVGEDIECGGMMLNYRGKSDGIIRDTYLNYQIGNNCRMYYLDYGQSTYKDYIRHSGMSWSGMWHSHGNYPSYPSHKDNKCIKMFHSDNKSRKECKIKNSQKRDSSRKITQNEMFYSPSLIINKDDYINNGWDSGYYAEFLVGDGKGRDVKVKNAKLEIIEEDNNIMPTLEEMVLEVGEKVKYKRFVLGRIMWGKKLKHFRNYNRVLEKYRNLQINPEPRTCQKEHTYNTSQKQDGVLPTRIWELYQSRR